MFGNFNSLIAEKSIKTKISTWLERLPITYKVFSETTLPEMLQLDSPLKNLLEFSRLMEGKQGLPC